jgi:capsular exopolysaccharide synthesis family protein
MNGSNGSHESPPTAELAPSERTATLAPRNFSEIEPVAAAPQEFVSLASLWHTLMKRRWTVVTVALTLTILVAIMTFRTTPVYRATAQVQVEAEVPLIQSLTDLYQATNSVDEDTFLQTQIQVVQSKTLAWHTIEQMGLAERLMDAKTLARLDPEKRKVLLTQAFQGMVSVTLTPKTRILAVNVEDADPRLAAQVATNLVNNYIDYNFRQKYDATRQTSGWMEQQLDELKAKVEQSQQALVEYERKNQLVNSSEKENVQEQMLADLGKDLTTAQSERVQKESLYRDAMANRAEAAALAHNELLQKLEEKAADLKSQYAETLAQYGAKFPRTQRLQQEIDENRTQIEQEQNRVLDRIRKDYEAALKREKLAEQAVAAQRDQVGALNMLQVQHNLLQREFEGNQRLYDTLLQKLKDATVSAGLRSSNIHMVDEAQLPLAPVRPRKGMNIAIGLLAGIVLGVMCAFGQEALDHSVKSAEEAELLLEVPVLVVVPLEEHPGRIRPPSLLAKFGLVEELHEGRSLPTMAMTVAHRPQSVLAEAYRALRTSILLSQAPNPPKLLLVASSSAGEGKTSTSLNLAMAMAQRKGPVLIMDCDMRKSGIARQLELDNSKGLSTYLTGAHKLDEVLQQYPAEPNLWVLTAGPTAPNPAELISSDTMAELCRELAGRFEQVILDSPPVMAVTDAVILSSLCGGVVLICESGRTPRGALLRTRAVLENAGARILGVVLNKFDLRREGYYGSYGYYYYYSHYYRRYPYGRESGN